LSQAVSYGDDATMATNYPIVRIRNVASGHVFYCRTSGHSTMGVATGAALHTTNFHVPAVVPTGNAELTVAANGIASKPGAVHVQAAPWPNTSDHEAWQRLFGSLADGPLWAWGPNGPVPVDPWGPEIVKEAAAARQAMADAMRRLQDIGARSFQARATVA